MWFSCEPSFWGFLMPALHETQKDYPCPSLCPLMSQLDHSAVLPTPIYCHSVPEALRRIIQGQLAKIPSIWLLKFAKTLPTFPRIVPLPFSLSPQRTQTPGAGPSGFSSSRTTFLKTQSQREEEGKTDYDRLFLFCFPTVFWPWSKPSV